MTETSGVSYVAIGHLVYISTMQAEEWTESNGVNCLFLHSSCNEALCETICSAPRDRYKISSTQTTFVDEISTSLINAYFTRHLTYESDRESAVTEVARVIMAESFQVEMSARDLLDRAWCAELNSEKDWIYLFLPNISVPITTDVFNTGLEKLHLQGARVQYWGCRPTHEEKNDKLVVWRYKSVDGIEVNWNENAGGGDDRIIVNTLLSCGVTGFPKDEDKLEDQPIGGADSILQDKSGNEVYAYLCPVSPLVGNASVWAVAIVRADTLTLIGLGISQIDEDNWDNRALERHYEGALDKSYDVL